MSFKNNIEGFEEIFDLIKKWFDKSLNISIKVPEDLADGVLYLELLKKCVDIEISNDLNLKYENIESVLDEFYGCSTNLAVDYYDFLFGAGCETIITLCILCFFMYRNFNEIPQLTDDDFKRLTHLLKPIDAYFRNKIQFTTESFHKAIEKAKERDVTEPSNSLLSTINNRKPKNRHNGSDDDISNSSNIRSYLSEYSINARSTHDSVSELGINDHSKDSTKRKHKINIINKPRRLPNTFLSPSYRRNINSPKLNESRKLEQRRLKNLEFENLNLKQDICHLNEDLEKVIHNESKANAEMLKVKQENRKLMDTIDCLNATIEEKSLFYTKKDKEFEKIRKEMETTKKIVCEKSDEIKQLENSNHKLRHDIDELNTKKAVCLSELKNKSSQCEESMKIEVSNVKEKHALQLENDQLKLDIDELKKHLKELHNSKMDLLDRDSLIVSPIPVCEEGESMELINQMKQAELIEKFESEKKSLEKMIIKLESELEAAKIKTNNEELDSKLLLAMNQLDLYQTLLTDKDEEIARLQDECGRLKDVIRVLKEKSDEKEMPDNNIDNLLGIWKNLLSEIELSFEDKTRILKATAEYLKSELSIFEKNHDICQKDLLIVYHKLKLNKEEIRQKEELLEQTHNQLFENEQEINDLKKELSNCRLEYKELENMYKIQKSKSADVEFKLRQTLFTVDKERKEILLQNMNLKTEISIRENQLQKSNQEFNILRNQNDEYLGTIKVFMKNCDDYEEAIKAVIERQNRPLRNVACQTDRVTQYNDKPSFSLNLDRSDTFRQEFMQEMSVHPEYSEFTKINRNDQILLRKLLPKNASVSNEKRTVPCENCSKNFLGNSFDNELQISFNNNLKSSLINKMNDDFNNSIGNDIGFAKPKAKPAIDPNWVNVDKGLTDEKCFYKNSFIHSKVDSFRNKSVVEYKKAYSPTVKPSRIHQMISRNLQQPDHLKSSYPIETQTLGQGYLADCLMKEINYDCVDEVEPELTPRLTSARHYIPADPLNLRSVGNNQKHYNYTDDSFSDQLLKGTVSNGLQDLVLSARSNNHYTPRTETFKIPIAPLKNTVNEKRNQQPNRDSDRENIVPGGENAEASQLSMKFEIPNSPRRKGRIGPRSSHNRNQRN